jgi:C4-dicarboxylate-specific signal transduction histidine kinase
MASCCAQSLAQRRERVAFLMTGDAVSASIAHEIKQPLSAIITHANAGLRWLDRVAPNLDEAKAAFRAIGGSGQRAGEVIESIRAMLKSDTQNRILLDINELINEALVLLNNDLQKHRVAVQTDPSPQLPQVIGDRIQLQQVLLNLITNAIDSMENEDTSRVLSIKSEVQDGGGVMISVADKRNRLARCRSYLQSALHDKVGRYGDGPVDLPLYHRSPRGTFVGCRKYAARRGV